MLSTNMAWSIRVRKLAVFWIESMSPTARPTCNTKTGQVFKFDASCLVEVLFAVRLILVLCLLFSGVYLFLCFFVNLVPRKALGTRLVCLFLSLTVCLLFVLLSSLFFFFKIQYEMKYFLLNRACVITGFSGTKLIIQEVLSSATKLTAIKSVWNKQNFSFTLQ